MSEAWRNGLWHAYSDHLRARFGERVYKATVSAGFTCPTRDGTRGANGCAFCDERGSSSFFAAEKAFDSVRDQITRTIPQIQKRFRARKFLAYFQSFTNTYGPLPYLRSVYDGALNIPDVVGLAIGTRPDCIPTDVLSLLSGYARGRYVSLELGIQSFRDEALLFYDRGHTVAEAIEGVKRALLFENLEVSVHLMFGAPGDTREDVIQAAHRVNELGVHGVKIHQLMILKDTVLAERYRANPWPLLSLEEYNDWAVDFLANLDPRIHVERTHALASHPDELVGPSWSAERFRPLNSLKHRMKDRGIRQGSKWAETDSAPSAAASRLSTKQLVSTVATAGLAFLALCSSAHSQVARWGGTLPVPPAPETPAAPTDFLAPESDSAGVAAREIARRVTGFRNFRAEIAGAHWEVDPDSIWRIRPTLDCKSDLTQSGVHFQEYKARRLPLVPVPIRVTDFSVSGFEFDGRALIVSCELARKLYAWIPILVRLGVSKVHVMSAYRDNPYTSFHTMGLGLDVAGFTLTDGTELNVERDFVATPGEETCRAHPPASREGVALLEIACATYESRLFSSVLTPNYNPGHRNHFHLDARPDDPRFFLR